MKASAVLLTCAVFSVLCASQNVEAQTLDTCSVTEGTISVSDSSSSDSSCSSASFGFSSCCGNVLAASIDEVDEAVCRTQLLSERYCDNINIGGCSGYTPASNDSITLELEFVYPDEEDTCCRSCKCYGDPLCESFNGTFDLMIECDARNFTTCEMEQSICRQQYDHAGNRCKWLKGNSHYSWWTSNLEDGSPCQADYNVSGQMELVLVDTDDDLKISTLIGERGVQTDFLLQLPGDSEPYQLNSDACFEYDPRDVNVSNAAKAWTLPSSESSLPSSWSVTSPIDVEVHWKVGDSELGIFVTVICTKAVGATRTRLDIDSIVTTQNTTAGDGFCFTGAIDNEDQHGSNVLDSAALHMQCLERSLPDLVNTCKALTENTCYNRTVEGWQQYWCENAELSNTQASVSASTYSEMVDVCLQEITNGTDEEQAYTWLEYACQMNSEETYGSTAQNSYITECMSNMEEFGAYSWSQTYSGIIEHQWTTSDVTCGTSIDNYTTIPDDLTCANGVAVEAELSNGTWVTLLYIPPETPPCSTTVLEATGDRFPELFTQYVRFRQCGLSAECLVKVPGTGCKPTSDVTGSLTLYNGVCAEDVTTSSDSTCSTCSENTDSPPEVCTSSFNDEYSMGYCETCCETCNYLVGEEDQSCRELMVTTPYCDITNSSISAVCEELKQDSTNATMTLTVVTNFSSDTVSSSCCNEAALWGDPIGQAFDGSREKLIVCDARDQDCWPYESICDSLVDHAGNPCIWNQTVRDLMGNSRGNIGAYGSPCLPDWEKSGEDEIVLYTVEDPLYRLSFYTGERSILDKLLLNTSLGHYTLDPEACYDGSEYAGWTTVSGKDISEALNLTFTDGGEDGYGDNERVWAVYDPVSGIFFRVTCVYSESLTTDYIGGYRLNIEHLVDATMDRDDIGGYAVNADMYQYGGEYTNNTYAEECEETSLTLAHLTCKAFWSGACTPEQLERGIERWCEIANQPDSVETCSSNILKTSEKATGQAWITAVCTALLPQKNSTETDDEFISACEDLGESTSEPYLIVEKYGSAGLRSDDSSYCASSVSEYTTRDEVDPCVQGISVQYYNGTAWVEVFFMPENLMPCNDSLQLFATDSKYYPLFVYPIRFEQCDVLNTEDGCPASANVKATCMASFGYSISYQFSYENSLSCPNQE